MAPATFTLESPTKGPKAYEEASKITGFILSKDRRTIA
jgi:hypothetical protein